MRWSFWSAGPIATCAMVAAVVGCTPSNKVPPGAPVMLTFGAIDPSGSPIDLGAVTEAGMPAAVPPLAHFLATFDRLLDPGALETLQGGGAIQPVPGVARLSWTGGATTQAMAEILASTVYTPGGDSKLTLVDPPGPSLTVNPTQGLPSGASVTVSLDPSKVRSHDQTTSFVAAPGVSATLSFQTAPLAVTFTVPPPTPSDAGASDDGGADAGADASADGTGVSSEAGSDGGGVAVAIQATDPTAVVKISFNDFIATPPTVTIDPADILGPGVEPTAAPVAMDPTAFTIAPPTGSWPAGVTLTLTVEGSDAFGQPLGSDNLVQFMVTQ